MAAFSHQLSDSQVQIVDDLHVLDSPRAPALRPMRAGNAGGLWASSRSRAIAPSPFERHLIVTEPTI